MAAQMTSLKDYFSKTKENMSLKDAQMNLVSVYLFNNIALMLWNNSANGKIYT